MDHGLRLRDRQHAGRGNPCPVLQLGISKLARDPADCSGCPVWRWRSSRDQCGMAHCMPGFDAVACAGSARSSDLATVMLGAVVGRFLSKSQIAHRQRTFLSTSATLNVDSETLLAPKKSGQFWTIRGRMILSQSHEDLLAESNPYGQHIQAMRL